MTAAALTIARAPDGWAVYLTNDREVARYRAIGAQRRALRDVARASVAVSVDGR